jgi:cyclophilin family peptidyl-prolyl cis-trans isomerase
MPKPSPAPDHKMVAFTEPKPAFSQESFDRALTVILSLLMIIVLVWLGLWYIPKTLYPQTDFAKAEQAQKQSEEDAKTLAKKQEELRALRVVEDAAIAGKYAVQMQTNYGDITLNLSQKVPVTADNFARLVYRKNYNNNAFTRLVKQSTFAVIEGGNFGAASGGALSKTIPDEVWLVQPTFDEAGKMNNIPQFYDPGLYKDFEDTGVYQGVPTIKATYPKGTIVMSRNQSPNSAGSAFFITLTDSLIQPDYTAFGTASPESMATLDKIFAEVGIVDSEGKPTSGADGKPDKEVIITSATLQ